MHRFLLFLCFFERINGSIMPVAACWILKVQRHVFEYSSRSKLHLTGKSSAEAVIEGMHLGHQLSLALPPVDSGYRDSSSKVQQSLIPFAVQRAIGHGDLRLSP